MLKWEEVFYRASQMQPGRMIYYKNMKIVRIMVVRTYLVVIIDHTRNYI